METDQQLPENKNWFKEGKVSVPYDQSGCGACWAFSTTSALESLAIISGIDMEI